jgi:hypothetical protein
MHPRADLVSGNAHPNSEQQGEQRSARKTTRFRFCHLKHRPILSPGNRQQDEQRMNLDAVTIVFHLTRSRVGKRRQPGDLDLRGLPWPRFKASVRFTLAAP